MFLSGVDYGPHPLRDAYTVTKPIDVDRSCVMHVCMKVYMHTACAGVCVRESVHLCAHACM